MASASKLVGAVLAGVEVDPLRFTITLADGTTLCFQLPDTRLVANTSKETIETVLQSAIGQQVEIETTDALNGEYPAVDIWYHEPIVEDDEVEYTSLCHLRTMLVRARLIAR